MLLQSISRIQTAKPHSLPLVLSFVASSPYLLPFAEMQHNQTKRKPHKRSRKGCTRCKGRHVRCDEVVPIWYVNGMPLSLCEKSNETPDLL